MEGEGGREGLGMVEMEEGGEVGGQGVLYVQDGLMQVIIIIIIIR